MPADAQDDAQIPWLHIYGLEGPHGSVKIIGTAVALQALRDAIEKVCSDGQASHCDAYDRDGEGYVVTVNRCTTEELSDTPLPYRT